ncbi:MAG: dihydrofolate reductase, partial [Cytophagales bacterium]|nr:dihydrofolate reductase [Cytophagales bacterium]
MKLSIIVAVGQKSVIGKDNALLWKLSSDMKLFRNLTMGHPVIMGRKTFESIGKPLPGRLNIVISRQKLVIEGVVIAPSLDKAVKMA